MQNVNSSKMDEYFERLDLLRRYGCDLAQGYFISRPLAAADFEAWLDSAPFPARTRKRDA
jgi:sensor c-di-GMP phosphodiesterase-like protein